MLSYLAWVRSSTPVISNCLWEGRSLRIFLAMISLVGARTEKWLAPAMLMKCNAGFCDALGGHYSGKKSIHKV
jgi:hypothetical protein